HVRTVFDEGKRGRAVIEIPAEAAIVEIDDLCLIAVDQQIGETHVAMNEAVALGPLAEGHKPLLDEIDGALKEPGLSGIESHAVAPRTPMLHRAEGAVEIPGQALEAPRPLPLPRMPVHARGRGTQHFEGPEQF